MTAEAVAGEWDALSALPAPRPARTWRYGPHASQVVDYYDPDGGDGTGGGDGGGAPEPAPRLTVLHGGYWRERYDRTHLAATAAALAAEGYAVALAEYRRVGGGGGWPRTAEDVAAVLAAAWPADGRGQLLLGHSAGGQLALWAAHRHPERLRAAVAVGAVADLALARALGLSDHAVDAFMGGPGVPLGAADPVGLPPRVPVALVHGADDPNVPVELSRRYAAATGAALREPPGTGHFAPLTPGTAAFAELLGVLRGLA